MERGNRRQREWKDEKVENKKRQKNREVQGRKRDNKKVVKEIEETERDKLGDEDKE